MDVRLTQHEIDVILDWFDFSISSSQPFGGSQILFPAEQILLKKFLDSPETVTLTKSELKLLSEIMETSIQQKYGSSKYLFGFEQQLHQKINRLLIEAKGS